MKKNIYIVLSCITIALLGYTLYYSYSHQATPQALVTATTTPDIATTTVPEVPKNKLTTATSKTILVDETNPNGESLSTITITPSGFSTNTPIVLEKNKLSRFFLLDMDKDSFDELILITQAQGSGSYGEATIFTTNKDQGLLPVEVPSVTEDMTKKGGLFEGYLGHDEFTVESGALVRTFPTYTASDTNSMPTGPAKKVFYTLTEEKGLYKVTYSKSAPIVATSTSSSTPITSTSSPATTTLTLTGTPWVWSSTLASGTLTQAPKAGAFVITFGKDMRVHSTTDCNTIDGTYVTSMDTLRVGALTGATTTCKDSHEKQFTSLLSQVRFYKITNNELTCILTDKTVMTFTHKK